MVEHLLHKVEGAAEKVQVSRATMFELIRTGKIASVKIGRSRRIPQAALEEYVAGLTAEQPTADAGAA